jgi:hypothetical protein
VRSYRSVGDLGGLFGGLKDRIVEGIAKAKTVQIVNQFIDEHETQLMEIWNKAQKGEPIEKIKR